MAQFLLSAFADEVSPDLEKQIEALQRNGIRYLEPRNISGGILTKTEEELYAIRARLDEAGIGISSLGSPIGKYNITDDFEPYKEEFRKAIKSDKPIGKKLDFVIQEMNRETNTIGSKCNELEITRNVVEIKSEIEKIREQIQNIE